ncbi:hypothetical protein RchiOBHm_Chr1g0337181 [Rosa chinensis]|uniref:Uncharacterized protein n=1 Tax=Rosa chinensis TaxID=74649 RepID=A0A2P6SCW1_ROSCH|nr:hypothetical protein RchiOBHm_Chr1g0337181 [Rosa chinensis]
MKFTHPKLQATHPFIFLIILHVTSFYTFNTLKVRFCFWFFWVFSSLSLTPSLFQTTTKTLHFSLFLLQTTYQKVLPRLIHKSQSFLFLHSGPRDSLFSLLRASSEPSGPDRPDPIFPAPSNVLRPRTRARPARLGLLLLPVVSSRPATAPSRRSKPPQTHNRESIGFACSGNFPADFFTFLDSPVPPYHPHISLASRFGV